MRRLRALGASADANSGGEIEVALRAGFAPSDIVFTGVGKTRDELALAVRLGLRAVNAESFGEIDRLRSIAESEGREARIAIRINPDVDAGSHPHISTGSRANKFGVSADEARAMARQIKGRAGLRLVGLHVHAGSQITKAEPVSRSVAAVARLSREFLDQGFPLEHLDVGGGLGIAYEPGQAVMAPDTYAAAVREGLGETTLTLVLEPGRWIVGPSGIILTEVVDIKPRADGGVFVVVDAGMTDLIRPALYGAWHSIEAVSPRSGAPIAADIVGPVCETSDTFAIGRSLPPVNVGDLLAIRDTGAYGAVMASNYNRRPLAAEVLADAAGFRIIRRRQTVDDMLQWDV